MPNTSKAGRIYVGYHRFYKIRFLETVALKHSSETSGASNDQVKQALSNALPTLVQSMQKNVATKSGEEALAKALSDHAKDDTSNISSFLKNVDIEDGTKILGHILGDNKKSVEKGVAKSQLTSSQTSTILATAAPLLLSLPGNEEK